MRSTNPSEPTVVDPEALMLVSLLHSSQEPRLGDLFVNWATHNVDLLSEQLERAYASSSPAPSAIAIEMRTLLEQHRTELGQLHAASWGAHERVHDWVTFGGEAVRRMALLIHPDTRLPAMEGT
jgi:hypothetical protein